MSHDHDHVTAAGRHSGRLTVVLALTSLVLVAEVVGALLSGSVALLADAGHMLTDVCGLALALVASRAAARPPTTQRTFGWQRVEVLAALANGILVSVVAVVVMVEGIGRLASPGEVTPSTMLIVASVGLVVNVVGLLLLRRGSSESLNIKGAYLEVLGDCLGSVAVIVAAAIIAWTGFVRADAIASLVIGLLIAPRAYTLLREVVHVLLEGTPREVDLDQVRADIAAIPGVVAVHDLHAWTITSGVPTLTAHVVVTGEVFSPDRFHEVLDALTERLAGRYDVEHSTFQLEPEDHRDQTHT